MKTLLIGEYREGKLLDTTYELFGFARQLEADTALLLVGSDSQLPAYGGTLYLADASVCGEYNPDLHKQLILNVVQQENPDYVVFVHSSYGWDLAPRVAAKLKVAQVSEIIGINNGAFEVGCCNAKMRRTVKPNTVKAVLTIQAGAFPVLQPGGTPQVQPISAAETRKDTSPAVLRTRSGEYPDAMSLQTTLSSPPPMSRMLTSSMSVETTLRNPSTVYRFVAHTEPGAMQMYGRVAVK